MLDKTTGSLVIGIAELAKILQVSRATAFSLARRNELPIPTIFIGKRRMVVSRAAVSRLLAEEGNTTEKD